MSINPDTFAFVATLVKKEAAIVLEAGKEYLVEARLLPLARAVGAADVNTYVADLRRTNSQEQIRKVVDALTTNETSWLRDSEPFQALVSDVVPALMASKTGSRTLNIWSAACSSGQEPYGIAMMLDDLLRSSGWRAEILATDISHDMLARAEAGTYSQLEVNRGLPAQMLVKYFSKTGASWKINDEVRRSISFKHLNLAQPFPVLPTFDIIFVRNVLIYFDPPTKRSILQRMRQSLSPQGYLFLGGAETTLGIDDDWDRVKVGRAYAHRPKGASSVAGIPQQQTRSADQVNPRTSSTTTTGTGTSGSGASTPFGGARVR